MEGVTAVTSSKPDSKTICKLKKLFFEKLQQLREKQLYCDLVVEVKGVKFFCHRAVVASWSPYIHSMLNMRNIEKEAIKVNFNNAEVFSAVMDYMYTCALDLREVNLIQVLQLATSFQIQPLRDMCEGSLRCNLHVGNITNTFQVAHKFQLSSLEDFCLVFFQKHLLEAVKEEDFLNLSAIHFNCLLSNRCIKMQKPGIKLFLILTWLGYAVEERERYFVVLLGHVDWSSVADDFLAELSQTENFLTTNESFLYLLLQTLNNSQKSLRPYINVFSSLHKKYSYLLSKMVKSIVGQTPQDVFCPTTVSHITRVQVPQTDNNKQEIRKVVECGNHSFSSVSFNIGLESAPGISRPDNEQDNSVGRSQDFENDSTNSAEGYNEEGSSVDIILRNGTVSMQDNTKEQVSQQTEQKTNRKCIQASSTKCQASWQVQTMNRMDITKGQSSRKSKVTGQTSCLFQMKVEQNIKKKKKGEVDEQDKTKVQGNLTKCSKEANQQGKKIGPDKHKEKQDKTKRQRNLKTKGEANHQNKKTGPDKHKKHDKHDKTEGHDSEKKTQRLASLQDSTKGRNPKKKRTTVTAIQNTEGYVSDNVKTTDVRVKDQCEFTCLTTEDLKKNQFSQSQNDTNLISDRSDPEQRSTMNINIPTSKNPAQSDIGEEVTDIDKLIGRLEEFSDGGDQEPWKTKRKQEPKKNNAELEKLKKKREHLRFRCEKCPYVTRNVQRLQCHVKSSHEGGLSYKCSLCSFECQWNQQFHQHCKKHYGDPPYQCDFEGCSRTFNLIRRLVSHKEIHTDVRRWACDLCSMRFRTHVRLVIHRRGHTGEKPFVCEICEKSFYSSSTLYSHSKMHSEDRPYVCDTCGFSTKYPLNLKYHCRLHDGTKLQCTYPDCAYTTTKQAALNIHIKRHQGIRACLCPTCGKSFVTQHDLSTHQRIHLEVKPFKCSECDYTTTTSSTCNRHFRVMHGPNRKEKPEKKFQCDNCDYRSSSLQCLKYHIRIVHGKKKKPFQCPQCDSTSVSSVALKSHIRKHHGPVVRERPVQPFKCKECDCSYGRPGNLQRHIRKHHFPSDKEPFKCKDCDYACLTAHSLNRHIRLEHCPVVKEKTEKSKKPEKPFKCKHCNRSYIKLRNLKHHTRIKHPNNKMRHVIRNKKNSTSLRKQYKSKSNLQVNLAGQKVKRKYVKHKNCKPTKVSDQRRESLHNRPLLALSDHSYVRQIAPVNERHCASTSPPNKLLLLLAAEQTIQQCVSSPSKELRSLSSEHSVSLSTEQSASLSTEQSVSLSTEQSVSLPKKHSLSIPSV